MKEFPRVFGWLIVVITSAWIAWLFVAKAVTKDMPEAGQLGDLFGGVNALFSGLALAGVVTAVILQSKELALQRQELEMTREELRRTADANQMAADALRKQIETQMLAAQLAAFTSLLSAVESQVVSTTSQKMSKSIRSQKYRAQMEAVLERMGFNENDAEKNTTLTEQQSAER